MENTQPSTNLNFTESKAQQAGGLYNSRLFVVVIISVLLTALATGLVVYFWQKSTNEKTVNVLEQNISSLERQASIIKEAETIPQEIDISPPAVLSPEPQQNNQDSPQLPEPSLVKGANLSEIKYNLPDGWEATTSLGQNNLLLSPKEEGGYLSIKVYTHNEKVDHKEYYCQLSGFCIDGVTDFTPIQLGNISGYKGNVLDNSGGGHEYFGAKGDKFYIISSFSPPLNHFFDETFQLVLDSLVF